MKLKYIALMAGVAMMSLSSCSDFLDKVPDTRVELETVEQLRELLVTGYTQYNYTIPCEMSTDNMVDNNTPNSMYDRQNLSTYNSCDDQEFAFEDVDMGTGSDTPSGIWEGCYHAIACANAVIERGKEMKANNEVSGEELTKLNSVLGEAYLIRAYHHWTLCNVFCMPYRGPELSKSLQGIPYMTKSETTVKPHYERGTLQEDYDSIETDMLKGISMVNDSYYEVPKYHFNKAAANAFAARFYLFKREYDKVVKYANDAFNSTDPATLLSDIWQKGGDFYYISDMGRYYQSTERNNVFLNMSTYSTAARRYHGYRYACNREAKRATLQGPGPSWQNCKWSNSTTKEKFAMHPCMNGLCGSSGNSGRYGIYFGPGNAEQFEYTDKLAGIGYAHIVRTEFWADETLLCRAEAELFLGDSTACFNDLKMWDDNRAKCDVNKQYQLVELTPALIRKFYKNDTTASLFGIVKEIHIDEVCPSDKYHLTAAMTPYLQCIQHYRRIETVHRGFRFFDIKRYGLEITHIVGRFATEHKLTLLDPHYALQIPSEVISAGFVPNTRDKETDAPAGEQAVMESAVYEK